MVIDKIQENGKIIITLDGRLDTTTAPTLQDVLLPTFGEVNEVELDFSKLVYVSSAGLRVLLMGHKTATAKESVMKISGVSDVIMEVLEMTGFSDMLNIE